METDAAQQQSGERRARCFPASFRETRRSSRTRSRSRLIIRTFCPQKTNAWTGTGVTMTEDGEDIQSEDELSCRRRRSRRRARCWSRFSSAVLCNRKSLENPPEGGTQRPEDVPLKDRGDKRFRMTRVLGRLRAPDVQRAPGQNRGSPKSFQKKLKRFFIWGQKRRSNPGDTEDTKVEEDTETAESPETLVVQGQAAEGPKPPTETSEVPTNTEPDPVQSVETNQVRVDVVSLEDDEVFVDLHDPLHEETRASRSSNPSINGPAIRIQVCPPQDFIQDEDWDSVSPSENHLHLLFTSDHVELQLLQTARLLVRTALRAAVDQLSREQQNQNQDLDRAPRMTSELQVQRRAEPGGALPVSSLLNVRF